MDVGVLSSGGKDSTLAALFLTAFCDVRLLVGTFEVTNDYEHAIESAAAVGFPAERIDLDEAVAREAVDQMMADGFPRNGIQRVHEHALRVAAGLDLDGVADGTRRDDRVPTVDRALAQHVEDRHGVAHLAPLAGIGRAAIDDIAARELVVETGPSEEVPTGDYEAELRALIRDEHGESEVARIFPAHEQSRVIGLRE